MGKPSLFVGCSREQMGVARAIQSALDHDAEMIPWEQGTFSASEYPLESLEAQLNSADFAVFVMAPDDQATIRGTQYSIVRDNVVFELGLFLGRIGRKRTFLLIPRGVEFYLPSDLKGLTPLDYDAARADGNLIAAVSPAASQIRAAMRQHGTRPRAHAEDAVNAAEEAALPTPENSQFALLTPGPSWDANRFESEYMLAALREQPERMALLDQEFYKQEFGNDTVAVAEWKGWVHYVRMMDGKPGSLGVLGELAESNPTNFRLRIWLGHARARYEDFDGAASAYGEALDLAGTAPDALSAVASLLRNSDRSNQKVDIDELKVRLQRLEVRDAADRTAYVSAMAKLAEHANLPRVALAIDEVVIKSQPDDIALRFGIAARYSEASENSLAIIHYEAIPSEERQGNTWNNIGVAYHSAGITAKAIDAYEKASALGETIADGNIANNLLRAGFLDIAQLRLSKAMESPDPNPNVISALSSIADQRTDEESRLLTIRETGRKLRLFRLQLGEAALRNNGFDPSGLWATPEGIVEVSLQSGDHYVGKIETDERIPRRGTGLLALVGGTETIRTTIEITRFGCAFQGSASRNAQGTASARSLIGVLGNREFLLYEKDGVLHGQWQSYDQAEFTWTRVDASQLSAQSTSEGL